MPRLAISKLRLPRRLVNCWTNGATQQAAPAISPSSAHQYPARARTVSVSAATSATSTSAAEASANIRCAWAATDAVRTRTGHQRRRPETTARPAASVARKKSTPNQGFQYGSAATRGCHATAPTTIPLAARPPDAPNADQAASIASEAATMHHSAAPHTTPAWGSICTGTASSQYCRGPGSTRRGATGWPARPAGRREQGRPTSGARWPPRRRRPGSLAAPHVSRRSRMAPRPPGARPAAQQWPGCVAGPAGAEQEAQPGPPLRWRAPRRLRSFFPVLR
jgi:hypothetical protein